jgi:hypothetical protein
MFRMLRTLPFTLALATLSVFTAGCGSSSGTKFRLVNAIPDVPQQQAVDVQIDGKVVGTVSLGGVAPASSGYLSVASGSRHLQLFRTGQTTGPYFDGNITFNSGSNTVVATGSVINNTIVAPLFADNATAPTSSNAQLRIIQASPEGFGNQPVDVYIVAPGAGLNPTPDIANVAYLAASAYKTFPAGTYDLLLTETGFQSINIRISNASFTAGKNYTYVLVDVQNGGQMSQNPVVLNDN